MLYIKLDLSNILGVNLINFIRTSLYLFIAVFAFESALESALADQKNSTCCKELEEIKSILDLTIDFSTISQTTSFYKGELKKETLELRKKALEPFCDKNQDKEFKFSSEVKGVLTQTNPLKAQGKIKNTSAKDIFKDNPNWQKISGLTFWKYNASKDLAETLYCKPLTGIENLECLSKYHHLSEEERYAVNQKILKEFTHDEIISAIKEIPTTIPKLTTFEEELLFRKWLLGLSFFNHENFESGITSLKSGIESLIKFQYGENHNFDFNNQDHVNLALEMVAAVGSFHQYDLDNATAMELNPLSMDEMYLGQKKKLFSNFEDIQEDTGVCKDITTMQGRILRGLGFNKKNGFDIFAKSYRSGTLLHSNIIVTQNNQDKRLHHVIN